MLRGGVSVELAELVRAAGEGDQVAWNSIVERFSGLIWATVRAHRLSTGDGAEVVQTTWLRLVEHLDRIRDPERLGGWLATTARRECLRCLRTGGRAIPVDDDSVFDRAAPNSGPELDADLLRDERDTGVWRAFGRISDRCQRLLRILTADPPPTYEDISETLAMPIGSIGPTRQRCLDRLRTELVAEGIASA